MKTESEKKQIEQKVAAKPYQKPELIEYGDIKELTQGDVGKALDLGGSTPNRPY